MKRPLKVITDIFAIILFLTPVAFLRYEPTTDPIPYVTMLLVCAFGALYFSEDIIQLMGKE